MLIQNIETGLRNQLKNRSSSPIISTCVATEFELSEGIHKNRNTRYAFKTRIFRPLGSEDSSLTSIGEILRDDLVGIHFSAWAVLAQAQKIRSAFINPKAVSESKLSEEFNDLSLALPKDLLRNAYLYYCFINAKEPAMEEEDDIATGLDQIKVILENATHNDPDADELLKLIQTNRPGGRGDLKPIQSEQLLFLWELLSIETERKLVQRRLNSEKDVFNLADDVVTQELIRLNVTTLKVVDRAI